MYHLLIVSNDGEWATDQLGKQWVKQARTAEDPACTLDPQPCCAVGAPVWRCRYLHPLGQLCTIIACERQVTVHWPIAMG